jgi:hypothetical protein
MKQFILSFVVFTAALLNNLDAVDTFKVVPVSSNKLSIAKNGESYINIYNVVWGPNWKWTAIKGRIEEKDSETQFLNLSNLAKSDVQISLLSLIDPFDDKRIIIDQEITVNTDSLITMIATLIDPNDQFFDQGKVIVELSDGTMKTIKMPLKHKSLGMPEFVRKFTLIDNEGGNVNFTLDPPLQIPTDKAIRLKLAGKELQQDEPIKSRVIITLPEAYTFIHFSSTDNEKASDQWYQFHSRSTQMKSSIDMSDWLEKPAGKHGRITRKDNKLIYNGEDFKLWGVNLKFAHVAPKKQLAKTRAHFYAKYGINAVRLHQFSQGPGWQGIQSEESVLKFDPEKLDKLDYFISELKKNGIYIKISLNFTLTLGPDDSEFVPYIDEFKTAYGDENKGTRTKTKHGSIFLSPELQYLQIQQMVNFLNHKNEYTGLTYAEDPAVFIVEMFNEDSALFFGTMNQLQEIPTLRQKAGILFTDWLENKYGSEEVLLGAWGNRALNTFKKEGFTSESWEEKTILPLGNPWYYSQEQLTGSQKFKKQRLLDTMQFLHELQNQFYLQFRDKIRETGYEGELIASNWKAGNGVSHFYNLYTDYLFGTIDRHSYFGGGSDQIKNQSMLTQPGSAILSIGMQQVFDRTFMISEWNELFPTEWSVEGPAIIGAYGMGLQGWDISFMFQNRDAGKMNDHFVDKWQIDKPTAIGLFPAVSRQVLRNDVKESKLQIPLNVNMSSVSKGELNFKFNNKTTNDIKSYDTDKVSHEALAIGRVAVNFTQDDEATPTFDVNQYINDGLYESSTKQLMWKKGTTPMDGFFTINSEGTKAVVGFAKDDKRELGNVTITSKSQFGAIYVTALDKNSTIETDNNLLITAIARVRQKGMKIVDDLYLLKRGTAPFMMEPVKASILINKSGEEKPTVYILDHDGVRTEKTIPIINGLIEIDTGRDETPYYEVIYE